MAKGFIWGLALVLGMAALGACSQESKYEWGQWALGLHVAGTADEVNTTKSYKQAAEKKTFETTGTMDNGILAGESQGVKTVVETISQTEEWLAVGTVNADQAFFSRPDDPALVTVVEARAVKTGKTRTDQVENKVVTDSLGNPFLYSSAATSEGNLDRVTTASTYGLAALDYVVRIGDLSAAWSEGGGDNGPVNLTGDSDSDKESVSRSPAGTEFLGKYNVAVGDFFVHPDGHRLYRATAQESIKVGGDDVSAVKVEVRSTSPVDSLDVAGRCLVEYTDTFSSDNDAQSFPTLHLDPGCVKSFIHRKVGTEWWYQNVLVKEEATYYIVTVSEFGYEWMIQAGQSLTRYTAKVKTADVPADARPFVEFTVTVKERKYSTTGWKVEKNYQEGLTVEEGKPGFTGGSSDTIPTHLAADGDGAPDGDNAFEQDHIDFPDATTDSADTADTAETDLETVETETVTETETVDTADSTDKEESAE